MAKRREFLANPVRYNPKNRNHRAQGRLASEKLNGTRAFWDGGITRGMLKTDVPFANNDKDGRYKEAQVATGLWSKYGNVIHAPDSFLDKLPKGLMLDAELWFGYNSFQHGRSVIASQTKIDADWEGCRFMTWAEPNLVDMFSTTHGTVKNANMEKTIDCVDWVKDRGLKQHSSNYFKLKYKWLEDNLSTSDTIQIVKQRLLGPDHEEVISEWLDDLFPRGGEGLILTNPSSIWRPRRCSDMLKVKFNHNEEAMVIGFVSGKITDKDSRNRGKIGSLICKFKDIEFSLSGFTDEERTLTERYSKWAWDNPDTPCPIQAKDLWSNHFKYGQEISFTYAEFSDDGIPKEARYYRNK